MIRFEPKVVINLDKIKEMLEFNGDEMFAELVNSIFDRKVVLQPNIIHFVIDENDNLLGYNNNNPMSIEHMDMLYLILRNIVNNKEKREKYIEGYEKAHVQLNRR